MQGSDVMSRDVVCIDPGASVIAAAQRMKKLDIGPVPICMNDELVGTLTDHDIVIRAVADARNLE